MRELHDEYDAYLPEPPPQITLATTDDEEEDEEEDEEQYLQEHGVCRRDTGWGYMEENRGGEGGEGEEKSEGEEEDEGEEESEGEGEENGDQEDEGEGKFDYKNPYGRSLSAQEMLSLSLSNICEEFHVPRRCVQKLTAVLRNILPEHLAPLDERTSHDSQTESLSYRHQGCAI
ncbi:hypothetical protein FN846DRAFT_895664 [Sphaerosporella brunnea]|uniref:Uncharacterized protein n=1 Tax=Sphaerosporella brunnea TaxID=1250544 RepID=A0A5J5EDU3_9PEZI|nr:hypothetical protein FN846DRAFT_895664 [Sphaerosporella brunnea]